MTPSIHIRLLLLLITSTLTFSTYASISITEPQQPSDLSFQTDAKSEYDTKLITRLKKSQVFERLRIFSEQDLILKQSIIYHFHQADQATTSQPLALDTASSNNKQTSQVDIKIDIPFSFLYQLDQGLIAKYPQQEGIQEAIYSAAVEKYLWFELGRALVSQFDLGVSGQEVFALDNFSTLMLINLNHHDSDFILEATEAFLLIRQSIPYGGEEDYEAEVSLDEQRYRKAVCLILGKDYLARVNRTEQAYHELLEELAWDQKKIEQCQKLYLEKLQTWLDALQPHLRQENRLTSWLAAH
ncbi:MULTISPECIES: DUF4344 domain-containing metallopeptidase [unclassified Oleiphilus]|jgi:hypothetical protein|nr:MULTISPECIES: DUF4344 domain-containing metallopeptidase [unclassified Oleiphilus]KZY41540.1 hypothetical protein A3732_18010 [Oleiphilus sp. HI0050]KZY78733.1 hypothetical protein A3741_21255 [Oleiphilus sp. HI0069]KZZ31978.1 hypothetical protein A3755_10770 [Oleiphilus sp. HI0085]KZY29411.1 hypothetical protein A3729_12300 [Oleiphilus sp. HI0043]KZY56977.1 hypothetical protein A3735_19120 [Oleiphilus sp. HI0061]